MSLQPIPPAWCAAVCTALKSGESKRIAFTATGRSIWQAEFPSAFRYHLETAFIQALTAHDVRGCPVNMESPPGQTWEFYFSFFGVKTYGKILLRTDQKCVVIFSAHRPTKPTLRCE
jgi:hypothetical protein